MKQITTRLTNLGIRHTAIALITIIAAGSTTNAQCTGWLPNVAMPAEFSFGV